MDPHKRFIRVSKRLNSVKAKLRQTTDFEDKKKHIRSAFRLHGAALEYGEGALGNRTVSNKDRMGRAAADITAKYKQHSSRQAMKRGAMIGAGVGAAGAGYMAYKAYKAHKAKKEQAAQAETPKPQ